MQPKLIPLVFLTSMQSLFVCEVSAQLVDKPDIRIFQSSSQQSEPHISINKLNPQNLLVSTNAFVPVQGGYHYQQGYYYSLNGGTTWVGADMLQNSWANSGGDPTTGFDNTGRAFIGAMKYGTGEYFVQTSTNGGANWTNLISAAVQSSLDKPFITVDDISTSPYVNNVYGSWHTTNPQAVKFNRSTNNGSTFSAPITLYSGETLCPNVQIGPNGEVYACWTEQGNGYASASGVGFTKSLDGGQTFQTSHRIFNYSGFRVAGKNADFGWTKVNDFAQMAVDRSNGPYRGRIYVVFPTNGNSTEIQIRYSDNQGSTWSSATRISNSTLGQRNFHPWIAVDDCSGDVWITYHAINEANWGTNTFVAESIDGGQSWINQKVSDVSHVNQEIIYPQGYIGDYIGIAAHQGKAYSVWADNRSGNWQLYVSPIYSFRPPAFLHTNPITVCNASQRFNISPVCGAVNYTYTITGSGNVVFASNGLQTISTTDNFVDVNFLNGTDEQVVLKVKANFSGYSTAETILNITAGNPYTAWPYVIGPDLDCLQMNGPVLFGEQGSHPPGAYIVWGYVEGQNYSPVNYVNASGLPQATIRIPNYNQYNAIYVAVENECGVGIPAIEFFEYTFDCGPGQEWRINPTKPESKDLIENKFSVEPNPATDRITVNIPNQYLRKANLKILDISGKTVKIIAATQSRQNIDISSLRSGPYVLQLIGKGGLQSIKFIKR